jgi:hypothetical protein
VLTGRDPAAGVIISIPPHKGNVTLTFDLHNRHTYSEEQMKDKRAAFARYTAVIGVLTADNTLVSRAVVQNEFRSAKDLVDRISGGAGPAGVKAVAPTGAESITIAIPVTRRAARPARRTPAARERTKTTVEGKSRPRTSATEGNRKAPRTTAKAGVRRAGRPGHQPGRPAVSWIRTQRSAGPPILPNARPPIGVMAPSIDAGQASARLPEKIRC